VSRTGRDQATAQPTSLQALLFTLDGADNPHQFGARAAGFVNQRLHPGDPGIFAAGL